MGSKKSLKVALHGMDSRSVKTMSMFLQRLCHNEAVVVFNDQDAEVDMFDNDIPVSKKLLAERLLGAILKPTIVLSISEFSHPEVTSVNKPVKPNEMMAALKVAKGMLNKNCLTHAAPTDAAVYEAEPVIQVMMAESSEEVLNSESLQPIISNEIVDQTEEPLVKAVYTFPEAVVNVKNDRKRTAKHQAAMRLDERSFCEFIGTVDDVDVNDPEQFGNASYDPSAYYQGAVQTVIASCKRKKQIFALKSHWKPLFLIPHFQEVWLDGSYNELKVFAGIKLKHSKKKSSNVELAVVESDPGFMFATENKPESMDSFLWKLACWTSMGRYPKDLDVKKPVYLSHWPNFTRLLITPHALRIAALLMMNPSTMGNVAKTLNIKPQYVFAFISAAHAIGIAGQGMKYTDRIKHVLTKNRSLSEGLLLENIMNKLHGASG